MGIIYMKVAINTSFFFFFFTFDVCYVSTIILLRPDESFNLKLI